MTYRVTGRILVFSAASLAVVPQGHPTSQSLANKRIRSSEILFSWKAVMTRLSVSLRLAFAGLLFVTFLPRASADANPGSLYDTQSPPTDLLAAAELHADGTAFSEIGGSCTPLVYVPFPNSTDCEATSGQSASFSADGGLTGELLLFSVLVLPQPSDGELMLVNPAASTAPPPEPFSPWPLAGVATAIVLIGGSSALRFRGADPLVRGRRPRRPA